METLTLTKEDVIMLEFDNTNPSFTTSTDVKIDIQIGDRKGNYDYNTGKLPRHFVRLCLTGFLYKCSKELEYNGTVYKEFKIEDYEKASILKEKIQAMIIDQDPNSLFNILKNE